MIVLAWMLVLRSPGSFEDRCDRWKAFYNRAAWRMKGNTDG